jgi:hypothetical protein
MRHHAVGGNHEVLNQLGGVILLLLHHVDHLRIQHQRKHFVGLKVERTIFIAPTPQFLRHLVLQAQLGPEIGGRGHFRRRCCRALQPRSHRVVLQLRLVANQGAKDVARSYVAVSVHHRFDDHAQAVLMFQQRSLARGKFFGQHGEVADSGVDRRRFPGGMLIDRSLPGDEGIYIGDADQNSDVAIRQSFRNLDLIQVAGGVVVDRGPQLIA